MHDELEKLILEWRESVHARLTDEAIEELEDHLRQRIEELSRAGLDATSAFRKAVNEIGSGEKIAEEFRKLDTRLWWPITVGLIAVLISVVLHAFLAIKLAARPNGAVLGAHVFFITTGYVTAFIAGTIGLCFIFQRCFGEFAPQTGRKIANHTARFAIVAAACTAIGFVLAMIWEKLSWGFAFAGDAKDIGGLCIFGWLICFIAAERSNAFAPRTIMMLSIIGNIIVALGWFGANLLSPGSHAANHLPRWIIVTLHVVALVVGLAPAGFLRRSKAKPMN